MQPLRMPDNTQIHSIGSVYTMFKFVGTPNEMKSCGLCEARNEVSLMFIWMSDKLFKWKYTCSHDVVNWFTQTSVQLPLSFTKKSDFTYSCHASFTVS